MVDSRQKGIRGEYAVRDLMREHTGQGWERTPASGATEHTKGDLYIPGEKQKYLIEVKNYKDSPLSPGLITAKTNDLKTWWRKIQAQAHGAKTIPVLFFKHDRSKWFVAIATPPTVVKDFITVNSLGCHVMLAEEWLQAEWKKFDEVKTTS
jgi:Holliday junction resolvase